MVVMGFILPKVYAGSITQERGDTGQLIIKGVEVIPVQMAAPVPDTLTVIHSMQV
jgi:hypothetical protein